MLAATSLSAQDDLDSYLRIAAQNNPGLKVKFNEYMAALEVIPQVAALPDPQLAFGYFIEPVQTRTGPQQFKLSASQMFPWFGTLRTRENIASELAKARFESFEEAKSDLFHQVRSAWYNIWFNKKAINITRENIEILNSIQQMVLVKVETGVVSPVDEYRIEIEIGDLRNQIALLLDQQYVLEVMFNNLLGSINNGAVAIPDSITTSDFHLSKQVALDSISVNNHLLLGLDLKSEALRYKAEEAGKNSMPGFNIGFDYSIIGKGENSLSGSDAFVFPRVGITVPLYRKKYRAMVQEVIYRQEANRSEKENRANMLETLFEKGWKEYTDAGRRIDLYKQQLQLADKTLDLLVTDYTTGNTNFEEILRMEKKLLNYNLELEKAGSDKQVAISFINYLMGK